MASARILDVAVVGQSIVAVGKAMAGDPCGVRFPDKELQGERLFLMAVKQETGMLERVVDLGIANSYDEVRLSHGASENAPLVAWTMTNGLCVMPVASATADCMGATLRCTVESGSFADIGVAATTVPLVLFRKEANGDCEAANGTFDLDPTHEHILLASDGDQKIAGNGPGPSTGIVQMGQGRVRVSGICAQGTAVGGQLCTEASSSSYAMFSMQYEIGAVDFAQHAFFVPAGTAVFDQLSAIAPVEDGVVYSAPENVGADARRIGWNDGSPTLSGLTFLKIEGFGDLDFLTGIRSAEVPENGQGGRIIAGVTHASPTNVGNNNPLFGCGLAKCAPYAFWFHAPSGPLLGTGTRPFAVVANDRTGRSCGNSVTAGERGLLLGDSAVLGGAYRCGRPAVEGTSWGLTADGGAVNAFLARLTPQVDPP